MTRALITGITGQDGSYLVEELAKRKWEIHGLMRKQGPEMEALGVEAHVGDLGQPELLKDVVAEVEPNVIFNLGGVSSVAHSWSHPEDTFRSSGLAVGTLLESAWKLQERTGKPVRFVQASSSEIFGVPLTSPQSERTPVAPSNPYGAAKAFAHHITSVYRSRGLWASNAILFNHESPRRSEFFVTRKITMGAARIALGMQDKLFLGNLDAKRDWGWAPDYVEAIVRMQDQEQPLDLVLSTGEMHSVRDFARIALEAAGIEDWDNHLAIDKSFMRPGDAHETRGDSTLARKTLGWQPTKTFVEIVKSMVEHDLEHVERTEHAE